MTNKKIIHNKTYTIKQPQNNDLDEPRPLVTKLTFTGRVHCLCVSQWGDFKIRVFVKKESVFCSTTNMSEGVVSKVALWSVNNNNNSFSIY